MPHVIRTDSARDDLKQIGRHLARTSGSRDVAIRWLAALGLRCRLYASHPEMGEPYSDSSAEVRRFSFGIYVVYFHRVPDGIELLRVIHGSREPHTNWLDD